MSPTWLQGAPASPPAAEAIRSAQVTLRSPKSRSLPVTQKTPACLTGSTIRGREDNSARLLNIDTSIRVHLPVPLYDIRR